MIKAIYILWKLPMKKSYVEATNKKVNIYYVNVINEKISISDVKATCTNEEAHDAAVEVCGLAHDDEGGAEGEEGPDDEDTAVNSDLLLIITQAIRTKVEQHALLSGRRRVRIR
jgi:hypothetical protein